MKKLLAISLLCAAPLAAQADTILGLHAGIGQWNAGLSGELGARGENTTADELGLDDSGNTFAYAALEHPVPLLPNIRLAINQIEFDGAATVERSFILDNQAFNANADTQSIFDISHNDATFYWEVLDNWVTLDLGVTARIFDGYAQVTGESNGDTTTERVEIDVTIPMLYSQARFDLPFSGVYAGGLINVIDVSGVSLTDLDIFLGYEFDVALIDLGVRLGYKTLDLQLDDDADVDLVTDLKADGIYAGITLHL